MSIYAMALAAIVAASTSSQADDDVLPDRAVRALQATPPSFGCHRQETPPNVVTLSCSPICANPPKIFSVPELEALDVSPKLAQELSHSDAEKYAEWHHYCDKRTP